MNLKPEQIPDEAAQAALEKYYTMTGVNAQTCIPYMKAALAAALPVLLGEPVAWTEKDGAEWVVYDANSEVGQHILHYQKDMHFVRIFPIFSFTTQDTPNADQ